MVGFLSSVRCLFSIGCAVLVVCCLLAMVFCSLFGVCCQFSVRCVLLVVCCLLLFGGW